MTAALAPDVWDRALALAFPEQNDDDRYFPQARPEQIPPTALDWLVWLILAGRGFGKTRTGAEWIVDQATDQPATRWAIVAPTYTDCRDTCIEGDSGVLAVLDRRGQRPAAWNRSLGELVLTNGSRLKLFSADEPERLRGPQHHGAWVDEPASFRYPDAWDQLQFGLRLGQHPRTVVTGTPKPTKLIRDLAGRPDVHVTRGSTFDNAANLAPSMLAELRTRYEGTRLGRQELYAEILDDVEGALWTAAMIDAARVPDDFEAELARLVVGVDPAVTHGDESDETGIVAVGRTPFGHCSRCGTLADSRDFHVFVLDDASGRRGPHETMHEVVAVYREHAADEVIVEANNGGDYLPATLERIDRNVRCEKVTATRGKEVRAQPIAGLYEQGRVHHVGGFAELEDQMCGWVPGMRNQASPDRMDALVWAVTRFIEPVKPSGAMHIVDVGSN